MDYKFKDVYLDIFSQYHVDKTLTACPPRPETGTGSGGATCPEYDILFETIRKLKSSNFHP